MRWQGFTLITLCIVACAVALLSPSTAEAAKAKRVYAGVYLHDVARFDQKDGVFDADFEVWAKWLGDFDPATLSIANAAEVERELIGEERDGEWRSIRWRVRGTLRGEFPVHRFPFDEQTLKVVLELPERHGELVPDLAGSGMRERFSITGWLYEPIFKPRRNRDVYQSDLGAITGEGKPTTVHRTAFEVTLRRPLVMAATKLFLPLLVILLVAVVALFIDAKELEVRAAVGVTALLACFAFQFAVADSMPSVAYVTLADVLFLVAYGLTALLMCVSVLAYWLHAREKHIAWRRLDVGAVIAFPLVLIAAVVIAMPPTPVAHADTPAEHHQPRPESTRDVVRIGMVVLAARGGGITRHAAQWATTRTELDGTTYPVLVDEVPGISNDALTFHADGTLEVRWRLRPGLKWSDGEPLSVEDLKFALEVSPDPRIASVDVKSETELSVRYRERVAVALDAIQPMPKHVLQAVHEKGGFEAVRAHRQKHQLPSLGPYHATKFEEDKLLIFERNPHFSGPPATISRVEIKGYKDDAALVAAFDRAEIDMIAPNALSPEAAQKLAERRKDAVHIRPSEVLYYLHLDVSNPLLKKVEVRRALLMALDRVSIRDQIFGETASAAPIAHIPVPGPIPKGTPEVAFDLEAARAALAAHGAANAKFKLLHEPTPVERAIAKLIVEHAGNAGLRLEAKEMKGTRNKVRDRNHGGLVLSSLTSERDDPPERHWDLPRVEGKFDRNFRSGAFNEGVAALIRREERALYPERREQIRELLFTAYAERLPTLPLMFLADRVVVHPELVGWNTGTGRNFASTIERWHFKTPQKTAKKP
jgi:peptide/nickel transport system substrate-binding protein